MSIGGGTSSNETSSTNERLGEQFGFGQQQSYGGSYIDPMQQGALQSLYSGAMDSFGIHNQYLRNLAGSGRDKAWDVATDLEMLGDPTQQVGAQLAGLRSGLDDMGGQARLRIADQAEAAGAFGGARQGLMEANLEGELADAYTQGYGDIIANAQRQGIDANTQRLGALTTMFNLGLGGAFGPYQALQGILGTPTVLNEQMSQGIDGSYGYDFGYGSSEGESSSARFGFGF